MSTAKKTTKKTAKKTAAKATGKATGKKAPGVVTRVQGVDLAKVNPATVNEFLVRFGLPTDGDIMLQVSTLATHQAEAAPKSACDYCGGVSDTSLPVCPFCGTGDDEEVPAGNPPGEDVAEGEGNPEPEGGDPEVPAIETTGKEVVAAPAKAPRAPRSSASITPAPATGLSIRDLDASVEEIHSLKKEAVVGYWRLGKAIFDCYERRLWALRRDEEGKPKFSAWNQFVVAELGMSIQHAYAMMDVAVNFSEKDVLTVGVSKLALLARVPPADREALLARVREQGLPLSQVADEVRRIAGGTPRTSAAAAAGGPGFRGGQPARGKAAAAEPPENQVTVAMVLGRKTIQLMRRESPDKPALQVSQDPVAVEQLLNGVTVTYRIARNAKGLALVIDRKREAAASSKEAKASKR